MSVAYELELQDPAGRTITRVKGSLPQDAVDRLAVFLRDARELRQSEYIVETAKGETSLTFKFESGVLGVAGLPTDTQMSQFATRLRWFVLQNEPNHLPAILKVLKRHVDDAAFRDHLDEVRGWFKGDGVLQNLRIFSAPVASETELPEVDQATALNSERVFDAWLNGHHAHRDEEKRAWLHEVLGDIPFEIAMLGVTMLMQEKARAVLHTAELVRQMARIEPAK